MLLRLHIENFCFLIKSGKNSVFFFVPSFLVRQRNHIKTSLFIAQQLTQFFMDVCVLCVSLALRSIKRDRMSKKGICTTMKCRETGKVRMFEVISCPGSLTKWVRQKTERKEKKNKPKVTNRSEREWINCLILCIAIYIQTQALRPDCTVPHTRRSVLQTHKRRFNHFDRLYSICLKTSMLALHKVTRPCGFYKWLRCCRPIPHNVHAHRFDRCYGNETLRARMLQFNRSVKPYSGAASPFRMQRVYSIAIWQQRQWQRKGCEDEGEKKRE